MQVSIYTKKNKESFWRLFFQGIKNLYSSNYLAYQLAKRDISGQYRQSFLGLVWSLVLPISTALIWIVLKNSGTVQVAGSDFNYPLYVFIGTMGWAIITESILGPINGTLSMRSTLSKINFPKEALILSSIYKTIFNTSIKLVILIGFLFYFKQSLNINILWFPLVLFIIFLFGTSLGLLITPIGLLYGDIGKLLTPLMQVLMYISPVVFVNPSTDTLYGKIMYYNPISPLLNNFRNVILGSNLEQVEYYFIIGFISFIVFSLALVFYKITIPIITERISA